jgi:hypothetical protein
MEPDFTGTIMVKAMLRDFCALLVVALFVLMVAAVCMAIDFPQPSV